MMMEDAPMEAIESEAIIQTGYTIVSAMPYMQPILALVHLESKF